MLCDLRADPIGGESTADSEVRIAHAPGHARGEICEEARIERVGAIGVVDRWDER